MRVFESLDRNAKAFAEFAELPRRPLRALQVASATLCALQLLSCNSLKLCGSAFRNELAKVESDNNIYPYLSKISAKVRKKRVNTKELTLFCIQNLQEQGRGRLLLGMKIYEIRQKAFLDIFRQFNFRKSIIERKDAEHESI